MLSLLEQLLSDGLDRGAGHLGYGNDVYAREVPHHYAEAYAYWGRGLVSLYRSYRETRWLRTAESCAAWLMENHSRDHDPSFARHPAWGLPWEFSPFQSATAVPAHYPFTVTTVFAGQLMLDLYAATRASHYLEEARGVARWLLQECGYAIRAAGIGFYYGSHALSRETERASVVYNVHSEAIGFLSRLRVLEEADRGDLWSWSRLARLLRVLTDRSPVDRGLAFLLSAQDTDGLWPYAETVPRKEHHQAYVLSGLLGCWEAGHRRSDLRVALERAIDGALTNLFDESGIGAIRIDKRDPMWLQFAALHAWAFWLAGKWFQSERYVQAAIRVLQGLVENYREPSGAFVLSPKVPFVFVRPSAQLFYALARIHEIAPAFEPSLPAAMPVESEQSSPD